MSPSAEISRLPIYQLSPTRQVVLVALCILFSTICHTQQFFPVKVTNKWGLINADGQVVLPAVYDAIGEFKHYGYAVMQREGRVGLLGPDGREAVRPLFEDIKVLDSTLIAVMDRNEWRVINRQGETVLREGYERISIIRAGYLAYRRNGHWGIVNANGETVAQPIYDDIQHSDDQYFLTRVGEKWGLLHEDGRERVPNIAEEIKIINDSLFFYRQGRLWGALGHEGEERLALAFESYRLLGDHFIKLFRNDRLQVFSIACQALLAHQGYDDFYSFSPRYIITKRDRRLGLLDWCGQTILSPLYNEIQSYGEGLFRVNFEGRWGVVNTDNEPVIPLAYDYIAPLQGAVCLVKRGEQFGVVNASGELVVPVEYHRIELSAQEARAYQLDNETGQEPLSHYQFDGEGKLVQNSEFNQHFQVRVGGVEGSSQALNSGDQSDYLLEKFEWFYSPANDRWGLRRLADGNIQIEPQFDYIQVEKDLGYTLVGIWKANDYEFERTTFRFDMILGLVLNDLGKPVTEIDFVDVRFEDFRNGLPAARVVFADGRHGLVDRIGRILRRDLTFLGDFQEGVARVSFTGRLSGKRNPVHPLGSLKAYLSDILSPSYMVDYTQYDQLFRQEALLICDGCEWGYMDTLGQVVVKPEYSFAHDMVNNAGLVACEGKWGMINQQNQTLIPCQYDRIEFLENTGNRMVRVYVEQPKYGLIDTLGQLTVSAIYEELGSFSEGRLAVKRNGLWGFVDNQGIEVIPCRFREVQNFSESLAAVRLGNGWGFIDKNGDTYIPFDYKRAGNFKNDLAWVYNDDGYGFINKDNDFVIAPSYDRAYDFEEVIARVVVDGDYGLIDSSGRFIVRPRYSEITPFDENGLAIVRYGNDRVRYGVINRSGQSLTSVDYRSISSFREGLAVVKDRSSYGYIDTDGRQVIPCQYSKAGDFHEGRASVQSGGKCGYIDRSGNQIIPCAYSRCQDFSGGRAVVYQGIRNAGIIDRDGQLIVAPSLDRLLEFQEGRGLMRDDDYRFYYITEQTSLYDGYYEQASSFQHGIAVVQINGKWGIINQKGIEIIPPKYDMI